MSKRRAPYPAWIYRQSALLPYRWEGDRLRVLLITSRGGKRWVVPKGIVEPGMSETDSALKEAHEEAGVDGRVHQRLLGHYRQDKWGANCEVAVYPLEVTGERYHWPEAPFRRRRWLSVRDACREVRRKRLRRIIERLPEMVPGPGGPTPAGTPDPVRPRLVYLLRHAKSSWLDATLADEDRPLAPRGARACEAMRRYMALADVHPDLVLCSSARRTRQTLELIRPTLGERAAVMHEKALYGASPEVMLEWLRGSPADAGSVMLVGHNPATQALALRLAGGGDTEARARMAAKFPTGALAILVHRGASWGELNSGVCELHSFVGPREIGPDPRAAL